ncbi:MAG: tetratricopeptide repeat protein, partial [Alphaproteobacteria bacterium]|nr:tetratricopeptide repeat protein [Alphaproteobacteria bacterium]
MTNPEHERARALEQHKAGDLEAAEAVYRGLLAANPEDGRTCGLLGLMRLQQGRAPEARELLERACRLVPEEAKHHNNLGNAELALGRPEAADKAFSRAVEGQPGEADFHVNAATAKLACGAHEAAIAGFQRALEIEADNFRAQHNLGSLLSRHNRVAEALPHLEAAAAHSACQAETLVNLASAYDRDNRLDEAEAVLARIPDDAPLPPPIQVFLIILRARHRRRRHDADGALGLLMPLEAHFASGANPELAADFHHELGRAADLAGDSARAFAAFLATKHCLAAADPEAASSSYLTQVRERRRTRPRVATAAARAADPTLAFFVGFPRSGTTLLEAMLDAHPGTLTTAEAGLIGAVEQCLEGAGDDLTEHAGQARKAYFSALAEHFGE